MRWDGLSFRCEMCEQVGDHVCKKELLNYIHELEEDSEELEGLYHIYRQLVEAREVEDGEEGY